MPPDSAPPQPLTERPPLRRDLAWAAACGVLTLLVYARVLGNDFVTTWDDGSYILHNESIRGLGLATVQRAFFEFHSSYWAPLTWLSFALDHALWGLQPFGFHLTNLVLHAANAGLAFLVARRL